MDCRTAQQLLTFDRPHAPELTPEDRAALGRHLAVCAACRAVEQSERRLDETLGKAMRAVEVPTHLEKHLHAVLDDEYRESRRRQLQRLGRYLAVAASLLLLVGGIVWWRLSFRPTIELDSLHEEFVATLLTPEQVEERFRGQGVTMVAPRDLNYLHFSDARLVEFRGRQVPMIQFRRVDGARPQEARVLILSARQFDLTALEGELQSVSGYPRGRVSTVHVPGSLWAYVYIHTGDKLDWLRAESSVS